MKQKPIDSSFNILSKIFWDQSQEMNILTAINFWKPTRVKSEKINSRQFTSIYDPTLHPIIPDPRESL